MTIDCISSMFRISLSRTYSLCSISSCSRIRVSGVRKSWLIAASMRVRFCIDSVMRSCIRLNACAASRISSGPSSAIGDTDICLPNASACSDNRRNGRITREMAQADIAATPTHMKINAP